MGVAKSVSAFELEIGLPVIVTQCAVKVFQDPHGLHGLPATIFVREKQGPPVVGKVVQPQARTIDVNTRLIGM